MGRGQNASDDDYLINKGDIAFSSSSTLRGNTEELSIITYTADTTPSVGRYSMLILNECSGVTDFDDAVFGQEINVFLNNNSDIVHTNGKIELDGLIGLFGPATLTLRSISGVWKETGRAVLI